MPGYPQITDYNEAVQHPDTAFVDHELRQGRIRENALGLPVVLSGGFALTYMVSSAQRKIAVRCFHREIPALEQKYAAISRAFRALNSPYFVDFEFLKQGIRVHRNVFPIVKMDWAEGDVLGLWLDRNCNNRHALATVRQQFAALAQYLEDQQIGHGDVQNGNVIVSPRGIKLVDYDGVYVPGMMVGQGSESGHKHFQHPQRDSRHHGTGIDRFSFLAIDLSIAALMEDPSLFRRYGEGGETILFHANDFADPDHSDVFDAVYRLPKLRGAARTLATICQGPIEAVPMLKEFGALREASHGAAAAAPPPIPPRPRIARYIGTYPVVDAADFPAVMNHIGRRVELVGRVVSVEYGTVKGGDHHGLPCLYVNLLNGWRHIVRLAIWSERGGFAEERGQDWVGKYVAVSGLIDQPFVSDTFLLPRTEVGIALDDASQLNFISAGEAERRLTQCESEPGSAPVAVPPPSASSPSVSNRQLLTRLGGRTGSPPQVIPKSMPDPFSPRPNRAIVGRLRVSPQPLVRPRPQPPVVGPAPQVRRRRAGPVPPMVIHPRMPGTPPPKPTIAKPPPPPTLLARILQALGLGGLAP